MVVLCGANYRGAKVFSQPRNFTCREVHYFSCLGSLQSSDRRNCSTFLHIFLRNLLPWVAQSEGRSMLSGISFSLFLSLVRDFITEQCSKSSNFLLRLHRNSLEKLSFFNVNSAALRLYMSYLEKCHNAHRLIAFILR